MRVGRGRRLTRGKGFHGEAPAGRGAVTGGLERLRRAASEDRVWVTASWPLHFGPGKVGGAPSHQGQEGLGSDFWRGKRSPELRLAPGLPTHTLS